MRYDGKAPAKIPKKPSKVKLKPPTEVPTQNTPKNLLHFGKKRAKKK